MVVTSVAFDEALHRRLAIAAIEDNAALTELVRQAVREYLDLRDRKRKGRSRR
jgi:predicted transcriptional regulator